MVDIMWVWLIVCLCVCVWAGELISMFHSASCPRNRCVCVVVSSAKCILCGSTCSSDSCHYFVFVYLVRLSKMHVACYQLKK